MFTICSYFGAENVLFYSCKVFYTQLPKIRCDENFGKSKGVLCKIVGIFKSRVSQCDSGRTNHWGERTVWCQGTSFSEPVS